MRCHCTSFVVQRRCTQIENQKEREGTHHFPQNFGEPVALERNSKKGDGAAVHSFVFYCIFMKIISRFIIVQQLQCQLFTLRLIFVFNNLDHNFGSNFLNIFVLRNFLWTTSAPTQTIGRSSWTTSTTPSTSPWSMEEELPTKQFQSGWTH